MQPLPHILLFLSIYSTVIFSTTTASPRTLFYRKDYKYLPEYNAYYKVHWDKDGTNWKTAFLSCEKEGSALFYPNEVDEWKVGKILVKDMEEKPNTTDVFIGVHDKFQSGVFITVDGHFLPPSIDFQKVEGVDTCVLMDVESDVVSYKLGPCSRPSPAIFICKKVDERQCPTIDQGYSFYELPKKCFKVNENAMTWEDAMHTCYMEGGILAGDKIDGVQLKQNGQMYYIGIRDLFHDGSYYTVKGKRAEDDRIPLQIPNYNNYGKVNEQIVKNYKIAHPCGALLHGMIQATNCYDKRPFICEMEAIQV